MKLCWAEPAKFFKTERERHVLQNRKPQAESVLTSRKLLRPSIRTLGLAQTEGRPHENKKPIGPKPSQDPLPYTTSRHAAYALSSKAVIRSTMRYWGTPYYIYNVKGL